MRNKSENNKQEKMNNRMNIIINDNELQQPTSTSISIELE